MNLTDYPYPSQRRVILGKRGAVATSQPLATLAGMEMFWKGGNAVDAAVATAIALTVLEPTSNGIGADAFALVWDGKLHGLNASGKSPAAMTLDKYDSLCCVPRNGWLTVTIPGAVSAWRSLWERWGKLPFEELFAPAIRYAEEGFPVSPVTAMAWKQAERVYLALTAREFQPFQEVFFPRSRAPKVGEVWGSIVHAETLRAIASSGGESFYTGEIAEKIANFAANTNGLITKSDLANHQANWVDPISTQYRHLRIWEIPPNTQGIATLMALNILENFEVNKHPRESVDSYHQQIEAMKLAFADVNKYVAEPRFMNVSFAELLDKNYAAKRQKLISEQAISVNEPGIFTGGTVYLCAADENLMVSLIQSNYDNFGSGILVPGTGIALQNRASGFTLEAKHPNQLAPEKRPFHTIIPGFITQENEPLAAFGVMGGQMQPQGHLQVVVNLADYNLNPQTALDAPRWRFLADKQVLLEANVPEFVAQGLSQKGHDLTITKTREMFGRGQIIWRQKDVLIAASEPRADGLALAW